ncbi:MAG TPA: hypothetical protein VF510_19365 [Ktedonobacterales bacterium]
MQIAYFIVCEVLTQDVGGFGSLTIQKEQLQKTLHFAGEWVQ